jgi:hypothetical protein
MDSIEFGFIVDETKIIRPSPIVLRGEPSEQGFAVVTEDPDILGLCHIFEGKLYTKGWQGLSTVEQAQARSFLLEGFESETWKYEESIEQLVKGLRCNTVGFGMAGTNHHTCKEMIEATIARVKKLNRDGLVISTVHDPWQVGLLVAAGKMIRIPSENRIE